jgi:DNA-binding MarR family transcriptional regulator
MACALQQEAKVPVRADEGVSMRQVPITDVIDAILRYLYAHPLAADSAEGIAKWWLPAEWCVDVHTVEAALKRLLEQGLIQRRDNPDRHVLYSR